jgi:hypothetical protein
VTLDKAKLLAKGTALFAFGERIVSCLGLPASLVGAAVGIPWLIVWVIYFAGNAMGNEIAGTVSTLAFLILVVLGCTFRCVAALWALCVTQLQSSVLIPFLRC